MKNNLFIKNKESNHTYVIAEAGLNHNGSVDIAKKLIDLASTAGADAVKFQKRTVSKLAVKATLDAKLAKQAKDNGDDLEDGQGHAIDRTQLLQEILGRNTHKKE